MSILDSTFADALAERTLSPAAWRTVERERVLDRLEKALGLIEPTPEGKSSHPERNRG